MLTLEQIAQLRACFLPTMDEQKALLDAAEALRLLQEAGLADAEKSGVPAPRGWIYNPSLTSVLCGPLTRRAYPHPTPQAAIHAALGPKEERDAKAD